MKKIIFAIILMFSVTTVSGQDISVITDVGQGMRWQGFSKPLIYVLQASVKSSYRFANNRLQVGTNTMTVYYDTEVELFSGPRTTVKIIQTSLKTLGVPVSIHLTGEALYGTSGRKLFGGGPVINIDPFVISITAYEEYRDKELWFFGNVGINLGHYLK